MNLIKFELHGKTWEDAFEALRPQLNHLSASGLNHLRASIQMQEPAVNAVWTGMYETR